MTAKRWPGHCYNCGREREIETRYSHGAKALCDDCAARPHRPPRADVGPAAKDTLAGGSGAGRYDGRVLDVQAMLAQPEEPIPWRCHGLAADGYLTVLAGRGGEGKSWLALTLACGVARGEDAAGIPCVKGRALIFDAENGPKLTIRRFRAAGVSDLAVQPVDAGGLKITSDLQWFKATIAEQKANLVVFDSLRVLASGAKENDGDVMEPIITALKQLARDTGAAVLLIHHRGKSIESDYRGTSVIGDQTDMMYRLERIKGDPDGRTRRKITTLKCRIDEEPEPRWVQIVSNPLSGQVLVDAAEPYEEEPARPRDGLRDQVLGVFSDRPLSGAAVAKALGRDKTDGTIRRVLRDLEAEGRVTRNDAGEWGLPVATSIGVGNVATPSGNGHQTAVIERWTCQKCGGLLLIDEDAQEARCVNGHRQEARS